MFLFLGEALGKIFLFYSYGSVPNYLESIGFSQSEQKKLRTTLTDSSGT